MRISFLTHSYVLARFLGGLCINGFKNENILRRVILLQRLSFHSDPHDSLVLKEISSVKSFYFIKISSSIYYYLLRICASALGLLSNSSLERLFLLLNLSFHPDQHDNLVLNPFMPIVPKNAGDPFYF